MNNKHLRSGHWDWWKGVAILAVILIHATGTTNEKSAAGWGQQFALVTRQLINFAVPLFLALAGYFAAKSWKGDAALYWRSRGLRIIPAYIVWTLIAVSLLNPWHFKAPRELASDVFLGTGIGIGYYVIVLLQYVALVPALARLRGTGQHVAVMTVTSLLGLAMTYAMQSTFADAPWARFPYYCLPFIAWAPFFHLGFWAGQNPHAIASRGDVTLPPKSVPHNRATNWLAWPEPHASLSRTASD